ncbi:MAG TPA: LPS assembly lipoprotein LptE [Candidatus Sulfotelmatobacter sp.]|nr:LPS assembly lipoprotein LptE [Candidatus Sulfotelmatobacter sp.]
MVRRMKRAGQSGVMLLLAGALSACGYHVAGRSNSLPKSIHVIAVPALENKTTTYKVEQKLTAATIHEFLSKTNFRVVSDPQNGDAVLTGKVLSLEVVPLLFQSTSSTAGSTAAQATAMLVTMRCEVTLTERDNDKVLYHTDNFVFRNEYQLATSAPSPNVRGDVESFFQEGEPALDRMAQDFATRLVAAVTENY